MQIHDLFWKVNVFAIKERDWNSTVSQQRAYSDQNLIETFVPSSWVEKKRNKKKQTLDLTREMVDPAIYTNNDMIW